MKTREAMRRSLHCLPLVNQQLSFSRFTQSASVRAAQAAKRVSGAVRSRAVGSIGMEIRSPASYRANLARALRYLSKGMRQSSVPSVIHYMECLAPEAIFELPSSELGGVVIGKRCGWSRNLDGIGHAVRPEKLPSALLNLTRL